MDNTEQTPEQKKLANLVPPFKPGQSGNPKGRPKGAIGFTPLLRRLLKEKVRVTMKDENGNDIEYRITKKRALLLRWLDLAMSGNIKAINAIVTRIDGKPVQPVDLNDKSASGTQKELRSIANNLSQLVQSQNGNDKPATDSTPADQATG